MKLEELKNTLEEYNKVLEKVDNKADIPLIGMLALLAFQLGLTFGVVPEGADGTKILDIDWSNIPLAIAELLIIAYLGHKKGIFGFIQKGLASIIKEVVKRKTKD